MYPGVTFCLEPGNFSENQKHAREKNSLLSLSMSAASGPPECVVELDRQLSTLTPEAVVIDMFTSVLKDNAPFAPQLSALLLRHLYRVSTQAPNLPTPPTPTPLSLLYLLDSIVKHRSVGPIYQLALLKSKPPSSPTLHDSFLSSVRSVRPSDVQSRIRILRILKTWGGIFGLPFVKGAETSVTQTFGAGVGEVFDVNVLKYRESDQLKPSKRLYFVNRRFFCEGGAVARVADWERERERQREEDLQRMRMGQQQHYGQQQQAAAYVHPGMVMGVSVPVPGMVGVPLLPGAVPLQVPVPVPMHPGMRMQIQQPSVVRPYSHPYEYLQQTAAVPPPPPPPPPHPHPHTHPHPHPFAPPPPHHQHPTGGGGGLSAEEELKSLMTQLEHFVGAKYERILRSLYGQKSEDPSLLGGSGSGRTASGTSSSSLMPTTFVQKCPKCGLRFYYAPELEKHMQVHLVFESKASSGSATIFSRRWMPSTQEWVMNPENNATRVVFENAGEAMFRLPDSNSNSNSNANGNANANSEPKVKKEKRRVGEKLESFERHHDVEENEGIASGKAAGDAGAAKGKSKGKTSYVQFDPEYARCPICSEEFERVFDDKTQEWMFVDAIEEKFASLDMKMVVHTGDCYLALADTKNIDMLIAGPPPGSDRDRDDSDTETYLLSGGGLDSPLPPMEEPPPPAENHDDDDDDEDRSRKRKHTEVQGSNPIEPPLKKRKLTPQETPSGSAEGDEEEQEEQETSEEPS